MPLLIVCLAWLLALPACAFDERVDGCLPKEVRPDTVVHVATRLDAGRAVKTTITVKDKLNELKAKCRKGDLIDPAGKTIRFYYLRGCWGAPPLNHEEIIEKQKKELDELKKNSVVIEIPCNPDPLMPPSVINPGGVGTDLRKP